MKPTHQFIETMVKISDLSPFFRYLTDNVPSLEMVPVTVSVYIADKDVRIKNVVISPSDRFVDILMCYKYIRTYILT